MRYIIHAFFSAINRSSHPFYDKHSELIRSLWTINKQNPNSDEKISQLKEVLKSANPNELCDIYDEKTGESRAKVPPLIIACFEGDFDTIKCLLDVCFHKMLITNDDMHGLFLLFSARS